MTHTDWELQRVLLSAYLDSELPVSERATIEAHLPTCDECQRELAALRQTRALLRALPSPALPRAFTMPETRVRASSRRRSAPAWARPAQALGSIAAMIGLGLLVATALPNIQMERSLGGASMAGDAHVPSSVVTKTPNGETPSNASATSGVVPPTSEPAYGPANTGSAPYNPVEPARPFPTAPVTGVTLLVGGAAAVTAGSLARRRGRRTA